jgi:hypothetical protein
MSAIFGVYNLNKKPISFKVLEEISQFFHTEERMTGVSGTRRRPGLGHRMLKTTPEAENEKLPLVSKTNHLL